MNWDIIKGKWKQYRGAIRAKWADLTDDDFMAIDGRREELVGRIQERYGYAKDRAEREVDQFVQGLDSTASRSF